MDFNMMVEKRRKYKLSIFSFIREYILDCRGNYKEKSIHIKEKIIKYIENYVKIKLPNFKKNSGELMK